MDLRIGEDPLVAQPFGADSDERPERSLRPPRRRATRLLVEAIMDHQERRSEARAQRLGGDLVEARGESLFDRASVRCFTGSGEREEAAEGLEPGAGIVGGAMNTARRTRRPPSVDASNAPAAPKEWATTASTAPPSSSAAACSRRLEVAE